MALPWATPLISQKQGLRWAITTPLKQQEGTEDDTRVFLEGVAI